jgi:hypothetical protein
MVKKAQTKGPTIIIAPVTDPELKEDLIPSLTVLSDITDVENANIPAFSHDTEEPKVPKIQKKLN